VVEEAEGGTQIVEKDQEDENTDCEGTVPENYSNPPREKIDNMTVA
jgi:hypothetical protein